MQMTMSNAEASVRLQAVTSEDVRRVVTARGINDASGAAEPMVGGMDAATRQALVELGYGSPLTGAILDNVGSMANDTCSLAASVGRWRLSCSVVIASPSSLQHPGLAAGQPHRWASAASVAAPTLQQRSSPCTLR
jgi:hypothetical protein